MPRRFTPGSQTTQITSATATGTLVSTLEQECAPITLTVTTMATTMADMVPITDPQRGLQDHQLKATARCGKARMPTRMVVGKTETR